MIAFASYLAASLLLAAPKWPKTATIRGTLLTTALGTAYTVASEWYHLRVGDWTYADAMPRVAGIGVSPLLQWLLLPVIVVFLCRARLKDDAA